MSDTQGKFYKKLYGKIGEKKAEKYLVNLGYELLLRNFTTPFGEADLVMADGETVVFIEVKSRSTDEYGQPSMAVNGAKQKRYRQIALYYMRMKHSECDVRFDIIEVLKGEINHIKGAFTG